MYKECNFCNRKECNGDVKRNRRGEPLTNLDGSLKRIRCPGHNPPQKMAISFLEAASVHEGYTEVLQVILDRLKMTIEKDHRYPYFRFAGVRW